MQRRANLINHSFRYHMVASILTMTAMNLNSIIDGILMGNMLGSEAFSAINVVIPVISCISGVGILLSQGPAMQMATHLGAMKNDRANQVFTVSIFSMLIVGLALSGVVAITRLADPVVRLLCVAQELVSSAQRYASVLMTGSILLILENGLGTLVDVMGNPRIVTISTIAKTVTNIIFDVLNIKVFGMDISGAAYATLLGSFVGIAVYVYYIVKKSDVRICRCPGWVSDLGSGVARSVPGFIGSLSSVALMFICNGFIMANQGGDGMFVLSIGYTLISFGSMISNGVGMTYAAIGGMLLGQEDYYGMRALFRRGILVTLLAPACFNLAGLFAKPLALAFGADTPELIALSQRAIPMICIMLFSLGIISSMTFLHTVLEHRLISSVNTLLILLSVLLSFIVSERVFPPDQIWLAFPLATAVSLLIFFADTTIISLRSGGKLQMVSLIPTSQPEGKLLDISVECSMKEKNDAIEMLIGFLHENEAGDLENSIVHCLDELMMNIITFSGRGKGSFMDLSVLIRDEKVTASLRDIGKPFDPLQVKETDRKFGLKLVFHFCKKLEYRYSFGQNLVLAGWDRTADAPKET